MPRFITPRRDRPGLRPVERVDRALMAYFYEAGHALLSREEEVELGVQMERGRRGIVGEVAGSGPGITALERLAARLRRGQTRPRTVLLMGGAEQERGAAHAVAELARRARELGRAGRPEGAGGPDEAERRRGCAEVQRLREALVERFFDSGLDPGLFSFAARRLEELAAALDRPGQDRAQISAAAELTVPELRSAALELHRARTTLARARERMIAANLKLVVSIARRFGSGELPLADLIQEGNIGLMYAVDRWDHRRGFKLSTYATWWIQQSIRRAIANQARVVRVPVYMREAVNRVIRSRRRLTQVLGRPPTAEELARATGTSAEQLEEILAADSRVVSLEAPLGPAGEGTLGDLLSDPDLPDPLGTLHAGQLASFTAEVLARLTPREARILALRFGIGRGPDAGETLEEVGRQMGLTRERIRQIQNKAFARLRGAKGDPLRQLMER